MRNRLGTGLVGLILLAGLSLLLYPSVSDWWNALHQSSAIIHYAEEASGMDEAKKKTLWESAVSYNRALAEKTLQWEMTGEERADYERQLDVTGTGIMGYVEIPQIDCSLPVYHGTDAAVLSTGAGHIEGSSLPVGGENTHAVISGHRGLPSSKLLTDLDQIKTGDVFYLHVLGETLAYEVDQIVTVEPDDFEPLEIQEKKDLCTLVTCTPYGINSHRLLVRGHRVAVPELPASETMQKMEKSQKALWRLIVKMGLLPVLLIAAIVTGGLIWKKQQNHRKRKDNGKQKYDRKRKDSRK